MHRFFVPPGALAEQTATISGDTAHQIARVLRMQPGDEVVLLDGLGSEYRVRLSSVGRDEVAGEIVEKRRGEGEPRCHVTLYLALLNKAEKFEWALQKGTELGVSEFVPVQAGRSVAGAPGAGKAGRWERILAEAAEQSGRASVPTLGRAVTLAKAFEIERARIEQAGGDRAAVIPAVGEGLPLREALGEQTSELAIFVGPEGGFTPDEVRRASEAGVVPITLGARVLRAETAAMVAVTMALYELGEMDDPATEW